MYTVSISKYELTCVYIMYILCLGCIVYTYISAILCTYSVQIICELCIVPQPADSVLLQVTLLSDGILEDFDGAEFAMDVQQLIIEFGFDDVTVSLYATLGNDEDGNTV